MFFQPPKHFIVNPMNINIRTYIHTYIHSNANANIQLSIVYIFIVYLKYRYVFHSTLSVELGSSVRQLYWPRSKKIKQRKMDLRSVVAELVNLSKGASCWGYMPQNLTAFPSKINGWKMNFLFWDVAYFQVRTVSFREYFNMPSFRHMFKRTLNEHIRIPKSYTGKEQNDPTMMKSSLPKTPWSLRENQN